MATPGDLSFPHIPLKPVARRKTMPVSAEHALMLMLERIVGAKVSKWLRDGVARHYIEEWIPGALEEALAEMEKDYPGDTYVTPDEWEAEVSFQDGARIHANGHKTEHTTFRLTVRHLSVVDRLGKLSEPAREPDPKSLDGELPYLGGRT